MDLYNGQRSASMVWNITSERFWRYQIQEVKDPTIVGKQMCVRMIVDNEAKVQGYLMVATKRWGKSLDVYALNIAAGVSWQAVTLSLLRALEAYRMQIPTVSPDVPILATSCIRSKAKLNCIVLELIAQNVLSKVRR
jgi:hypothetical protein